MIASLCGMILTAGLIATLSRNLEFEFDCRVDSNPSRIVTVRKKLEFKFPKLDFIRQNST